MESAATRELRVAARSRVVFAATIEFGPTIIPCRIRNMSDTGAEIAATSPLWFPEQFTLRLERDGSCRKCQVVWQKERRIGVRFE